MTVYGDPVERATLAAALTSLEIKEHGLLAWGVIDAVLTSEEVDETLLDVLDDLHEDASIDDVRRQLLDRGLLLQVPGAEGYRTRMAETMRILATLRQTFRNESWWEGRPLVLDYRFFTRPRFRPKFDLPRDELIRSIGSAVRSRVVGSIAPRLLAGFQDRGAREILHAIDSNRPSGIVITAGTGSGKTHAFYLPTLAWIGETLESDPSNWLRALTLYPRQELLRDQLQNCVELTTKLHGDAVTKRPISVGAWYGATPSSPKAVSAGQADGWTAVGPQENPTAWICPFLRCPRCDSDLHWVKADINKGIERLTCSGGNCGTELGGDAVRLTRASIRRSPPDLLFTTTESLNRQMADSTSWAAFGISKKPAPRIVLLDEIHTYEGVTGAQNAHLLRRYRQAVTGNVVIVGLSATLTNAEAFTAQLTGLRDDQVAVVRPSSEELEAVGAEYLVAIRHDPGYPTSPLSTTIQTAMAISRSLDMRQDPVSAGLFGHKTFLFGDRHDTINRLLWDTLDAEGWWGLSGRLRRGRQPLTLAHLRSERQGRRAPGLVEPALDRLPAGQWWWHSEAIGHRLDEDQQMRVARTTSKDPGVSQNADIIVATATLEVGYDDDGVGAVIQHKSPHDAARFIQRQGRAGRDVLMRPWTVVVLADFGRDRLTWDTFERLFDPQLPAQHLPNGNRYVQRMQSVYAFLDWLSSELVGRRDIERGSTWRDLSSPAELFGYPTTRDEVRARQEVAVEVIDEVLDGGPAFDRFRQHLRRALGLSDTELDAVFWSPPRSLMMAVLPTARRRLDSQWRDEQPDSAEFGRTPLPEFMTSSQFGDLLTPEVEVSIPTTHGNQNYETAPTLSVLTEYLPGNVSRRHSIHSPQDRHWIAPPDGFVGSVDIEAWYDAEYVRSVTVRGPDGTEHYSVYRPRRVSLAIPPPDIAESTSVRPVWRSRIEPIGDGARLDLPNSHWTSLLGGVRTHLHMAGDGTTITRLAARAEGSTYRRGEYTRISISFETSVRDDDAFDEPPPPVLGLEFEADGLFIQVVQPEALPPVSPIERVERFESLVESHLDFQSISVFDRQQLGTGIIAAVAMTHLGESRLLSELDDAPIVDRISTALRELGAVDVRDPDAMDLGDTPDTGSLEGLIASAGFATAVRDVVSESFGERNEHWEQWARRRLAATVGAVFLSALIRLCPDLDIEELSVDVDADPSDEAGTKVWITEVTPGGNGYLEQVHHEIARDPMRLLRLLDRSLEPSDIESLDSDMRRLLDILSAGGEPAFAANGLRDSWSLGHNETSAAHRRLVAALAQLHPTATHLSMATLVNRVLGPGSHPDLPDLCRSLSRRWDELESVLGFTVDPRVFAAVATAHDSAIDEVLHLDASNDPRRRARSVENLLWPRGRTAQRLGLSLSQQFGQGLSADRLLLAGLIDDETPRVRLRELDIDTIRKIKQSARTGRVEVSAPADSAHLLHQVTMYLQSEPIELGALFTYATLEGVSSDGEDICAVFVIHEAAQ